MYRARYGERVRSFHALSRPAISPASPCVHQPRSSPYPVLLAFYGGLCSYSFTPLRTNIYSQGREPKKECGETALADFFCRMHGKWSRVIQREGWQAQDSRLRG